MVVVAALPVAASPAAASLAVPALRGVLLSPATGPAPGTISTVVGGVGGPARGRRVAVSLCGQGNPCPLTFAAGRLWFGDENHAVRALSIATGWLTTPAGNGLTPNGLTGTAGDGGPATAAWLGTPGGIAVDSAGNLIFADLGASVVRFVAARTGTFFGQAMTAGHIYTVAGTGTAGTSGDGGPATAAGLLHPVGVSVDAAGNLVIACSGDQSGAVPVAARVRVVAAATGTFYGQAMTAGDIYTVAGGDTGVAISGNGGPAVGAGLGLGIGSVPPSAGEHLGMFGMGERARILGGEFYAAPVSPRGTLVRVSIPL